MEASSINMLNEDPFATISAFSRISTSQEHLLHHIPFAGDTRTSQDLSSQFEPENPISSTPIVVHSPSDSLEVFHTPPEEYPLPSPDVDAPYCPVNQADAPYCPVNQAVDAPYCPVNQAVDAPYCPVNHAVDAPYCPVNQAVDVHSRSQVVDLAGYSDTLEFMDFGKDFELGFLDVPLKNQIDAGFVQENEHSDEFRVSKRGISDLGESPVKKLKLGFDSLGNSLGAQHSHTVADDGIMNSEERVESPCNVVGGEKVNDVSNREILMDDNSVPEENVETQAAQNDGDVNWVERSRSSFEIGEGSGTREDPVLRVLPNSIRCLLEKSTETAIGEEPQKVEEKTETAEGVEPQKVEEKTETAEGVEPQKVEEKKEFSVFDVLKILSENTVEDENTVEEEYKGLTMLEAAKRSGMTFPRPTWWPDHYTSDLFIFDDEV